MTHGTTSGKAPTPSATAGLNTTNQGRGLRCDSCGAPPTTDVRGLELCKECFDALSERLSREIREKANAMLDALDASEGLAAAGGEAQRGNVNFLLTNAARNLRAALDA
jgi:hypothetical protein